MLITAENMQVVTQGFRAVFLKAYEGATPDWSPYAMEVNTNHEIENLVFLTGLPQVSEIVGEVKLEDIENAMIPLRNKEWASTVPVSRATIERDSIGVIRPTMAELGFIARQHPRVLLAQLLDAAFTTGTDYTGTAFFSANKPYNKDDKSKGRQTFTNNGTAALSADSLIAARTNLRKRTDAKGNNLGLGTKLLLIVPPALEQTANHLRTAELLIYTAGQAAQTNTLKGTFDVLVLNQLSSDTAWFLMETGREIKPMVVQFEVQPEFIAADDPRSTHVLLQKVFYYQAYGRWNCGYALPQLAYGSTGAGV